MPQSSVAVPSEAQRRGWHGVTNAGANASRLRRLNSRQRKKLHVGEFQQFVFELKASLKSEADDVALLDALIAKVESQALLFGGSVGQGKISGVVSAQRGSPTEQDRQAMLDWLKARPEVAGAHAGEFVDAWYGWH